MSLLKALALSATILLVSGCASMSAMPLHSGIEKVDLANKGVLLGRLMIKNENRPGQQPALLTVFVEQDGKMYSRTKPTLVQDYDKEGKDYLISIDAPAGAATLKVARFLRQVPLLMMATADLPFEHDIDIAANQFVYIGRINAVIKARESDDQPRAGSLVPLIDQAVAGFSNGTFEVDITDHYDEDVAELRSRYPYLVNRTITKAILPPWVHPGQDEDETAQDDGSDPTSTSGL